ncbi:YceD family protein [Leptolyngbya sp. 7M]|uniref:YceD family protein n=1 Tax=Leptolyngbya sp. 7M TaxID=2812896 RepID=UPI001B8AFA03|nr:DUF177 domain-containing protein [Leptolyngbya sp. 7M]QYO66115.1 DUF177 domain-containing protein [Leptolyngbya sp. 7M]
MDPVIAEFAQIGIVPEKPLVADIEIVEKVDSISIAGVLNGSVLLACTRCLGQALHNVAIDFSAEYVTEENFPSEAELEVTEEAFDLGLYDGTSIDLAEVVREQILLDIPERVLCRDDCGGICQKCGSDLNVESCGCEEVQADPRWSALKELKN